MAEAADRPGYAPESGPPAPRSRGRRRKRLIPVLTLIVVLMGAGVVGAGGWVLRTESGRDWLRRTLVEAINGTGVVSVELEALNGDLPFSLELVGLTVSDADGMWLSADRLALAWDPAHLLDPRFHIDSVHARGLLLDRLPVFPASEPKEETSEGFDFGLLGLLTVADLRLDGVFVGSSIIGEPVLLDVAGRLGSEGEALDPTAITAALQARRIDGELAELDAKVRLEGPAFDHVNLDLEVRADSHRAPDVVQALMPHPVTVSGQVRYGLSDNTVVVDALRIADDHGVALTAKADAALSPLAVQGEAVLDLARLDRLAPVLGSLSPAGSGTLTLDDITLDESLTVSANARLTLTDAALGLPQVEVLLGSRPDLTARVAFDPADGLSVTGLTLSGALVSLAGAVSIPADFATLEADLSADLASLDPLTGGALVGAATVRAHASGALGNPDVSATVQVPTTQLAGQVWHTLNVSATAAGVSSGPSGTLEATATSPAGPVSVSAAYALPGFAVAEVSDLSVEAPGLRLGGTARADLATLLTEGSARLSITDARTLAAWGAPGLRGSLTADVTLNPSGDRQHVTATARGADVSLSDGAVSLGALTVDATVDDAFGGAAITAKVRSETGGAGAVQWDTLAADLNGTADDLTATVDLSGTGPTGPLTLAAATRVRPGESRATLTRLTLDNAGRTLAARAPATVTWADGVRVDRLALDIEDGVVTVQGGMTGNALDVSVSADAVPLTLAELAAPDLGLSGRLDATVTLSGRLPTPEGTLRLGVREVSFADAQDAPPLAADVSGRLGGGRLTAEATLSGFAERPARATADLALVLGADGPIPPDAPLRASVDWNGPVGRVWEMLPLIDHRLSGNLVLTATVNGTLAAPGIAADVRLTGGEYEHLTAGTLIDDLSVTASATGTDQVTVSLSGTDGGSGRLSGEGDVRLGAEGPEGAVSVRLDKAMVVRRDDVTASADADLTLDLAGAEGARLSGWVETGEVRVRLVGAGAAAVPELETIEIRDETGTAMEALERAAAERGGDEAAAAGPDVALDIAVRMPNRVYVTGQGLDSEWGGDLQVGGTAAAPRINGTIDIRRGTIEVIGRTLTIRTGQIRFAGGRRINPLIDVLAAYESTDAEARIGLRGPADDPQLVLESTPPRPRDEVLSLILFDKRTGELTTLETVQLARALAALTGVGGGAQTGILDTVRQATGLDVLRFGQGGEGGGPGVEAGTYLGDDIYVGVEQGIDAGDGGVSVEVDLGAGFRVESKARRSGTGEVGVLWRRDY